MVLNGLKPFGSISRTLSTISHWKEHISAPGFLGLGLNHGGNEVDDRLAKKGREDETAIANLLTLITTDGDNANVNIVEYIFR
ncbi:hypothetical protein TNCV_1062011 [Trichonephila clavipes]|nr:hypothetical protein TNCV_1062011 [Trichonephila clavipes]